MPECFFCGIDINPGEVPFTVLEHQGKILHCCSHKDCVSRRETIQLILPGYMLTHYSKVRRKRVNEPAISDR